MKLASSFIGWLVALTSVVVFIWRSLRFGPDHDVGLGLTVLGMGLVAGLLIVRRPENRVTWAFGVAGVTGCAVATSELLGVGPFALLIGSLGWPVWLAANFVFIPALFPNGRVVSERWRWITWLTSAALVVHLGATLLTDQLCVESGEVCEAAIDNPIGIEGFQYEPSPLSDALYVVLLTAALGALVSLGVRFKRSRGLERRQLKWLVFAASLLILWTMVAELTSLAGSDFQDTDIYNYLLGFIWLALPVSAAVAITRYRLYEIDRLVSRTVTYGLVIATLVGVYALAVGTLSRILPRDSDIAVAASTLAVAAAFNPLRRWIKAHVDRRFNRARYDATQVINGLAGQISAITDVDEIVALAAWAATNTMHPSSLSWWVSDQDRSSIAPLVRPAPGGALLRTHWPVLSRAQDPPVTNGSTGSSMR